MIQVEAGEACFEKLKALKAQGYNVLIDMTAIDWSAVGKSTLASAESEEFGTPKMKTARTPEEEKFLAPKPARFEVVYRLAKIDPQTGDDNGREEVRTFVSGSTAELRSAAGLYPIADWLEREVWDMFGIPFADRPDIKRLLMYEQFQGHPLRKDYPIGKRQPLIGPASGEKEGSPTFNLIKPTIKYE